MQLGCGHLFCELCIKRALEYNPTCPTCRTPTNSQSMHASVWHRRTILGMYVRCPANDKCGWQGSLRYLENHLAASSSSSKREEEEEQEDKKGSGVVLVAKCAYVCIPCPWCKERKLRGELESHALLCDDKPVACPQCQQLCTRQTVATHELDECPESAVMCPLHCHQLQPFKRRTLPLHFQQCPNFIIPCPLRLIGCQQSIRRKDLELHIRETLGAQLLQHALSSEVRLRRIERFLSASSSNFNIFLPTFQVNQPTAESGVELEKFLNALHIGPIPVHLQYGQQLESKENN